MKTICNANELTLTILSRFKKTADEYRLMNYCVQSSVEEGVLLLNTLTRELVLLTQEEHENLTEIQELKDRWFVVPQDTKEKELAGFVRWVLENRQKKPEHILGYTIYTTTDCNARCFYCFELGRSRIPMSQETAENTVQYIKNHCGGQKVRLSWFGGEPLFNQPAIDTICDGLRREGIEFTSKMVSNGYLFDHDTVSKAVESWNLQKVQITLDGTEEVYNRCKAFIYKKGSPYQVVLNNMERLLDAGIQISVRLNIDLHNAQDLLVLVEELAERFKGHQDLTVYAHHIFYSDRSMAESHSDEEWELRDEMMCRLEEKLIQLNLDSMPGIRRNLKLNHCIADGGRNITILPNGDIGLCEHHTENEFIGHIDREGFDEAVVKSWKVRSPELPECAGCFSYPECIHPKKCVTSSVCFRQLRQERLRKTQRQMVNEYRYWQYKGSAEALEDDDIC